MTEDSESISNDPSTVTAVEEPTPAAAAPAQLAESTAKHLGIGVGSLLRRATTVVEPVVPPMRVGRKQEDIELPTQSIQGASPEDEGAQSRDGALPLQGAGSQGDEYRDPGDELDIQLEGSGFSLRLDGTMHLRRGPGGPSVSQANSGAGSKNSGPGGKNSGPGSKNSGAGSKNSQSKETDRRGGRDTDILPPGTPIGDYRLGEVIGKGGCGTVYAAEHCVHRDVVAIKVLRPGLAQSPQHVRRFVQEAKALQLIEHPGIVEVYDDGYLSDGRPYFVMELLSGSSVTALLHSRGRLSPAEALELLEPVCEIIHLAHKAGIVHRDIKASNIMVTGPLEEQRVKLLDFGLAKLTAADESGVSMQTSRHQMLGTLHSMAPEQILGGMVDARTDIYALGALLHRLVTGRHPFEDSDGQKIAIMHLKTPPPAPSQLAPVTPGLDLVVKKAMDKEPSRRYQGALDFLTALRDAVGVPSVVTEQHGQALAIYVEGRVSAMEEGAIDDTVLTDLMAILDTAEELLDRLGFQILMQTTHAILAATLIPGDTALSEDAGPFRRAIAVAHALSRQLRSRPMPSERVHVNICLHQAPAAMRTWADQATIVGGPITNVGVWAPRHPLAEVCATRDAAGAGSATDQFIPIAVRE